MAQEDITWPVNWEDLKPIITSSGLNEENAEKARLVFEHTVNMRVAACGSRRSRRSADRRRPTNSIRKVGALARAGSLSSASGAWAAAAPADSASNRSSIAGGGVSARHESVDDVEKAEAASVFSEVAAGMLNEDVERFKTRAGNVEFDGDQVQLRSQLKLIRQSYFGSASQVAPYVRAISRSVMK
jgi:hypothetical protein